MKKTDTKLCLAEALFTLASQKAYEKISVSDIVEAAGKSRKTFYYHFVDKPHLTAWLFRLELSRLLEKEFAKEELVYQKHSSDPCSELPYYVFVKRGVRSLDGERFLVQFAKAFESRRSFFAQALREKGASSLDSYLYNLYLPVVREDILFILSSRHLPQANVDFLTEFYTNAMLSFVERRTCDMSGVPILSGIGPFANILHSSIEHEIREQQLKRML